LKPKNVNLSVSIHHQMTGHKAAIYSLAHGPASGTFFSGAGDGWIASWNIDTPETGALVASTESHIFSILPLSNQQTIVAGNMDGGLHWLNPENPTQTKNIAHHKKGTFSLLQIDDNLYSGGGQGLLTRWDIANTKSVESLRISGKSIRCLTYDPDEPALIAGCSDGAIHFIDPKAMSEFRVIPNADQRSVFSLAFTICGRYLVSGGRDARLRIWDKENGYELIHTIPAHWFTINSVAVHPSLPLFATGSRDKTVKIWSSETFDLLKVLNASSHKGHRNSVNALLWLSEHILLSAADDRTIIAWSFEADSISHI